VPASLAGEQRDLESAKSTNATADDYNDCVHGDPRHPWHVRQAAAWLRGRTGLPQDVCFELVRALYARMPAVKWILPVGAPLAFFGWMLLFGRVTDVLEGTRWDLLAMLHEGGIVGGVAVASLGFGVGITLALLIGGLAPHLMLQRAVRHHLHAPACFWCGQLLRGVPPQGALVACPECGKASPVRARDV